MASSGPKFKVSSLIKECQRAIDLTIKDAEKAYRAWGRKAKKAKAHALAEAKRQIRRYNPDEAVDQLMDTGAHREGYIVNIPGPPTPPLYSYNQTVARLRSQVRLLEITEQDAVTISGPFKDLSYLLAGYVQRRN